MLPFLKRFLTDLKGPEPTTGPLLEDLNGLPLSPGDTVESLRYDLGVCRVITGEKGLAYRSIDDGREVGWHLMVDASTDRQKVRKQVTDKKEN